jgi:hypothetical protein
MRALIAMVSQHNKINNFLAFKNGTGARLTGQFAPNQEVHSLPMCVKGNGAGAGALNNGKRVNIGAIG